ncbi:MAG: hypothetical protein C4558_00865 [Dehalococcoidia bacterium]|nr:MAG: hypothetical protein C4558_00865 [Dehalococcoidia bacterium]
MYADAQEAVQFVIYVIQQQVLPIRSETWNTNPPSGKVANRYDKTEVEGHPAIASHIAEGDAFRVSLDVFDESSGIRYVVHSLEPGLTAAEAVDIVKGLLS